MALPKIIGLETEFGIVLRGTGESNPIAASSVLINAYMGELARAADDVSEEAAALALRMRIAWEHGDIEANTAFTKYVCTTSSVRAAAKFFMRCAVHWAQGCSMREKCSDAVSSCVLRLLIRSTHTNATGPSSAWSAAFTPVRPSTISDDSRASFSDRAWVPNCASSTSAKVGWRPPSVETTR